MGNSAEAVRTRQEWPRERTKVGEWWEVEHNGQTGERFRRRTDALEELVFMRDSYDPEDVRLVHVTRWKVKH